MCRDQWLGVELRHLAALAAIAGEGSFRGAADQLGYVQSSVSQQLAALERVVGARLVERSPGTRPPALTPAGELLLQHAESILAQVKAAKADLDRLGEGQAGEVRVGAFQSVVTRAIPRMLMTFANRCPGVDVRFGEWATDAPVFDLVADGTLDLGFAQLPLEPGPFACCELVRTPTVLMVAADSQLACRDRPPTLAEIARLPLIGRQTCRMLPRLEEQLKTARGSLDVLFRSDLDDTTQALVGAGLGVALASPLAIDGHDERIALVDLGDRLPPTSVGLFWHRERLLTPAAEEFGEIAREICAEISSEVEDRAARSLAVAA
jgi:molybdate transport repressor ModE-like protein